jgi:uncharacterized protein (DUF433 family)
MSRSALHQGHKNYGVLVLELLEAGIEHDKIIRDYYPQLKKEDIEACLQYAASLIRDAGYVRFQRSA